MNIMAEAYKTYDFDEYIRHGEPSQKEKAEAWKTAIGLQAVDGLKPSQYLYETAQRHIEGELTIDEVKAELRNYYNKKVSRANEEDCYEIHPQTNADLVMRLTQILGKEKLSAKDLSYKLGLGDRVMLLNEHYLTPAMQTGFVRMLYPDSPRHPRQKYLLTVKGLSFYNENLTSDEH